MKDIRDIRCDKNADDSANSMNLLEHKGRNEEFMYHQRTRRIGFYVLIGAFVVVVLAFGLYAIITGNERLIERILFLFVAILGSVFPFFYRKE